MRYLSLLILLSLASTPLFATHNKGGHMSYRHINGFTYEITVNIFGNRNSPAFQRREIVINYGHSNASDSIAQTILFPPIDQNTQQRVWVVQHTFPGPGNYTISVTDPNRNGGINNIVNSSGVPFYVECELIISPFNSGVNNSAYVINNPILEIKAGASGGIHINAIDPDGDLLKYELVASKGYNASDAPGYQFIKGFEIDPLSGLISYNTTEIGLFSYAVRIREYRDSILVGSTLYDMQLAVSGGFDTTISNLNFSNILDSCMQKVIIAYIGDTVNISGKINSYTSRSAIDTYYFPPRSMVSIIRDSINISWIPDSSDARCNPYFFSIRINDDTFNNSYFNDEIITVRVLDSALRCDSLCNLRFVSVKEHPTLSENIQLYPNPLSDHFFIETPLNVNLSNWRIQLFNLHGQLVEERSIKQHNQLVKTNIKAGIYYYRIMGNSTSIQQGKLIVN